MAISAANVETSNRAAPYARSLLQEWMCIVNEYCRVIRTDSPFWHKERPQVGLLAAAAWRSGLVALEEFGQAKKFDTSREYGRADLWISNGPDVEEFIEARYIDWNPEGIKPDGLRDKLYETIDEVHRIQVDHTTTGLAGIVIWSPQIHAATADEATTAAETCITLCRQAQPDALAWCFPEHRRTARPDGTASGPVWPGTLILATWAKRSLGA